MTTPTLRLPLLLLTTLVAACAGTSQAPPAAAAPPRLVVLCSVDQLAAWVFAEAAPFLADDGGFRRLLREGARLSHCAFAHACTETGPGHATIGTGAPAAVHGIVRNLWWSPERGATVYCAGEPAAALPGLPEGRDRGPGRLLAETLAQRMRAELPGCRTASVAWKDRSAILMVGANADVAAWFEASTGNLVTNTIWCPEVPAWLAEFNRARAIDSFYGAEWGRVGPEAAYAGLVDDRPYEYVHQNGRGQRTLPQPIVGDRPEPDVAYWSQVYASPFGNEIVRLAAQACVDGMALGADDVPDLLAVSFSSLDIVGHYFGPDSVEARDTLLRLDRQLADLLAFLDDRVGAGRWAMFLTADHGVGPTPEWAKARGLPAGRGLLQTQARAAAEKALRDELGAPPEGRRFCAYVGEYALVLDRGAVRAAAGDAAGSPDAVFDRACRVAAEAAARVRGIARAYATRSIFDDPVGDDPFRAALRAALHPARAGDVQLVTEPYWLDGALPASHGTPHAYDREVVGLAVGPGVARGVEIADPVTPGFGVVLLAELLGIAPPAAAVDALPATLLRPR